MNGHLSHQDNQNSGTEQEPDLTEAHLANKMRSLSDRSGRNMKSGCCMTSMPMAIDISSLVACFPKRRVSWFCKEQVDMSE
jgi:hypothetical protein